MITARASIVITEHEFWVYGPLEVLVETGLLGFRRLHGDNDNPRPGKPALSVVGSPPGSRRIRR